MLLKVHRRRQPRASGLQFTLLNSAGQRTRHLILTQSIVQFALVAIDVREIHGVNRYQLLIAELVADSNRLVGVPLCTLKLLRDPEATDKDIAQPSRSEEHTSELQSP